ncbi:Nose resistant to fluoxetine protein 6 like protein [Argiope bruennichi]|uniref:Nose resistant to fluoxetine protein 6 like protein n=1 Tax=Argiope bruennichi TaxID=94029 RepID=A0A8T0FX25_ARGBR|nr:Nose resistant to fluoxetine protein 6 like protein [Argiope bruennichi]
MDTCTADSCDSFAWQATCPTFVKYMRSQLLFISNNTSVVKEPAPKNLTVEALYMICVILCFVALSAMGSSLTALEYATANAKKDTYLKYFLSCKEITKFLDSFNNKGVLREWRDYIKCFCLVTNGRLLLKNAPAKNHLECIDGIRFFSFCWTVVAHCFALYFPSTKNLEEMAPYLQYKIAQILVKGDFIIDIFLVISGLLNGYGFVQSYEKNKGNISWFHFYVKRIIRITPAYVIVLGFYITLFSYMGSGPLWPVYTTNPVCKDNWWWNLLFINNFLSPSNQCMFWTWYLAADFQFYVLSPLFLISIIKWPRLGYILIGVSIGVSSLITFIISKQFDLISCLSRVGFHLSEPAFALYTIRMWEFFDKVYQKPYTRISAYLIGLLLGHELCKRRDKSNKITLYCGWMTAGICMWLYFFRFGIAEDSGTETAFYNAIKFILFSSGTAWFVFLRA